MLVTHHGRRRRQNQAVLLKCRGEALLHKPKLAKKSKRGLIIPLDFGSKAPRP
jgi:hypothetical protein